MNTVFKHFLGWSRVMTYLRYPGNENNPFSELYNCKLLLTGRRPEFLHFRVPVSATSTSTRVPGYPGIVGRR
eukprot:2021210-Rhodomonas_salina.1